jgi:hypothetical protein
LVILFSSFYHSQELLSEAGFTQSPARGTGLMQSRSSAQNAHFERRSAIA